MERYADPVYAVRNTVTRNICKHSLWFSLWENELLPTPETMTFLAKSLPKTREHYPSNAIP